MAIKICLDAGHDGKYNRSPIVPAYYESDFNWNFHLKLKAELEAYGFQVVTTRANQNVEMGTKSRGRAAQGCDILLSIHSNSADRESADYPLVIVPVNGSGDELGKQLSACIRDVMDTNEPADMWSKKTDSGTDWYGVINGAAQVGVPGIILEHSFYTNKRMAEWMMVDDNLDKLAKAEADVLAAHCGIQKPEPTPSVQTYEVLVTINRYNSEGNAKARTNPAGTYSPGTYYIYNKYPNGSQGMLNITMDKTGNTPGSWINPADNVIPKQEPVVSTPEPAPTPEVTPTPTPTPTPIPDPDPVPEEIPSDPVPSEPVVETAPNLPEVEPEVEPETEAPTDEPVVDEPISTVPKIEVEVETPSEGIFVKIINLIIEFIISLFKK